MGAVSRSELSRAGSNEDRVLASSGVPLADVLKIFARLEPDCPARRNAHFFSGARVAADAALARLHLKDTEPTELDTFAALHGGPHRIEDRVNGHLGLHLGDVRDFRHFVD